MMVVPSFFNILVIHTAWLCPSAIDTCMTFVSMSCNLSTVKVGLTLLCLINVFIVFNEYRNKATCSPKWFIITTRSLLYSSHLTPHAIQNQILWRKFLGFTSSQKGSNRSISALPDQISISSTLTSFVFLTNL